jgi:short-subunit dehydrogenase
MAGTRNKTWLVTGASSGLGRALADELLRRGDRVAVTARDISRLEGFCVERSDRIAKVHLDMNAPTTIAAALAETEARLGSIDVLVNNAGRSLVGAIEETSEAEARALFETNFFGMAALTAAVISGMRRRRTGHIVALSSISGVRGTGGSGYYSASKFAVEGFADALRQETAEFGIQVMIVEPGPFRTDFFGRSRVLTAKRMTEYSFVEKRRNAAAEAFGQQPGDPLRAAHAIMRALEMDKPPERLILGAIAAHRIQQITERRLLEIKTHDALARSADFDDG